MTVISGRDRGWGWWWGGGGGGGRSLKNTVTTEQTKTKHHYKDFQYTETESETTISHIIKNNEQWTGNLHWSTTMNNRPVTYTGVQQ